MTRCAPNIGRRLFAPRRRHAPASFASSSEPASAASPRARHTRSPSFARSSTRFAARCTMYKQSDKGYANAAICHAMPCLPACLPSFLQYIHHPYPCPALPCCAGVRPALPACLPARLPGLAWNLLPSRERMSAFSPHEFIGRKRPSY